MQEYRINPIEKDQIVPVAEKMKKEGIFLVMIHGFKNKEGKVVVTYDYAVDPAIESYHVVVEDSIPTISHIYDTAASWPEREINELMDMTFEGLDTSKRLFMPDNMLDGQGQILVTPMDQLIDKAHNKKED